MSRRACTGRRGRIPARAGVTGVVLLLLAGLAQPGLAYKRPGQFDLVSIPSGATHGNGDPRFGFGTSSISANGRYVAFDSLDDGLVVPDRNPHSDIFVRDRKRGITELVHLNSKGEQGLDPTKLGFGARVAWEPRISATGRHVVFTSSATNLVDGDDNSAEDIFVHDLKTRATVRVSVASDGTEAKTFSQNPSISGNGRYVTFASGASNLVAGDTNEHWDIFVHDLKMKTTERVSMGYDGSEAAQDDDDIIDRVELSAQPVISATGRHVAFLSWASNLVRGDTNKFYDVFVHDRKTGKTKRASVASDGSQAQGSGEPILVAEGGGVPFGVSADGRYVAFVSSYHGFVPNDTTGGAFVHDTRTGRTERASVASDGSEPNWPSGAASMSADGRYVLLGSGASNLSPYEADDTDLDPQRGLTKAPSHFDVYVHDRKTGATELISLADGPTEYEPGILNCSAPDSSPRSISSQGRFISFTSCEAFFDEDENSRWDVYAHDRGPALGAVLGDDGGGDPGGGNQICITPEVCIPICITPEVCVPPARMLIQKDPSGDVKNDLAYQRGADIIAARVVYRPQLSDLYIKIDIDKMPGPRGGMAGVATAGNPALVYGLRFGANDVDYEVRAAKSGRAATPSEPAFGLFRCTGTLCTEVAGLTGGYGTVGESIVVAVPLATMSLDDGGTLAGLEAFSAVGTYGLGARRLLDRAVIQGPQVVLHATSNPSVSFLAHPGTGRAGPEPTLVKGIRPGTKMISPNWCTMNFVFARRSRLFIGTAGHCVSRVGEPVSLLVETDTIVRVGKVVFRAVPQSGGVGASQTDDFALVSIKDRWRKLVSPEVAFWGGPSAPTSSSVEGEVLHYVGHGVVVGTGGTPRTSIGTAWSEDSYGMLDATPAPGDSGAPVILDTGEAVGIVTEGGFMVGATIATGWGPTTERILRLLDAHRSGFRLKTATSL